MNRFCSMCDRAAVTCSASTGRVPGSPLLEVSHLRESTVRAWLLVNDAGDEKVNR